MIDCIAEESRRLAKSPHLGLGPNVRLMAIFVDAWADHNWGVWESALNAEFDEAVLTPTRTNRLLDEFGLVDRHGLFEAAGLSDRQKEVMEARYPDGPRSEPPTPIEIAQQLGWPSLRVRVHLHEGYARLRVWAAKHGGS